MAYLQEFYEVGCINAVANCVRFATILLYTSYICPSSSNLVDFLIEQDINALKTFWQHN